MINWLIKFANFLSLKHYRTTDYHIQRFGTFWWLPEITLKPVYFYIPSNPLNQACLSNDITLKLWIAHLKFALHYCRYSLECEIIHHLLLAQIRMVEWQFLPALLQLHEAHTKLQSWGATALAKEVCKPVISLWVIRYFVSSLLAPEGTRFTAGLSVFYNWSSLTEHTFFMYKVQSIPWN